MKDMSKKRYLPKNIDMKEIQTHKNKLADMGANVRPRNHFRNAIRFAVPATVIAAASLFASCDFKHGDT
jgi:hypothetical protein